MANLQLVSNVVHNLDNGLSGKFLQGCEVPLPDVDIVVVNADHSAELTHTHSFKKKHQDLNGFACMAKANQGLSGIHAAALVEEGTAGDLMTEVFLRLPEWLVR